MSAYRSGTKRLLDLEIDSTQDVLLRIKVLRRCVALPTLVIAAIAAWLGGWAHAAGRWSLYGVDRDGSYFFSAASLLIAAMLCVVPIALPGVALYVVKRAALRSRWIAHYRDVPVADAWPERSAWFERTSRRFS